MVVKDRVGRSRYIVFKVEPGGFERGDIIRAINHASSKADIRPSPRLTVFDGRMGIVRCDHRELDDVKGMFPSIKVVAGTGVKVETVKTSGTLRKAKEYLE